MELYSEANTLDNLENVKGFDSVQDGKYLFEKTGGVFIPSKSDVSISTNGGLENGANGIGINTDNLTTKINSSSELEVKLRTSNGCINADSNGVYVTRNPESNGSGLERNGNGLRVKHGDGLSLDNTEGLVLQTVDGDEIRVTPSGIVSSLRSFVMLVGIIRNSRLIQTNIVTTNNTRITPTGIGGYDIRLQKGRYLCSCHIREKLDFTITTSSSINVVTSANETFILDCKEPNDKFELAIAIQQLGENDAIFNIEITYLLPVTQI